MIKCTGGDPVALEPATARLQLEKRAKALALIREYFAAHGVLEVDTPVLSQYTVSDPQLDSLKALKPFSAQEYLFLQTSPEYAMKQLLAKGSGSIFQICKSFRADIASRLHTVEFTMLEWYRESFDLNQLINDVASLVKTIIGKRDVEIISYQQAFMKYVGIDPFDISSDELRAVAKANVDVDFDDDDDDVWFDLLLTHNVEPHLGKGVLSFLIEYPVSQAALAKLKLDKNNNKVAERFELYIEGVEIANGYNELTSLNDHLKRSDNDNYKRALIKKDAVEFDLNFKKALELGLKPCSGVALGFDRLMLFV